MKIRAVRTELFHADRRADIRKLRRTRFTQFWESF